MLQMIEDAREDDRPESDCYLAGELRQRFELEVRKRRDEVEIPFRGCHERVFLAAR